MHQSKIILSDNSSLEKISSGLELICNPVKRTLGPKGCNVMYADPYGIPRITSDGVTVARQIFSDDETEQMVIDAIKQNAMRCNRFAGDASTTFTTLVQAIYKEGQKSSKHPLEKQEEITQQCELVIKELKKNAKSISTFEEIKQIATISARSEEIGEKIAEATKKVGKEGKIDVQESETNGIKIEYAPGLEIEEGYVAEFMMNNERGEVVLNNPYILIIDSKLSNIKDVLPIMQKVVDSGANEILLLCDGLEGNMLPTIALNKRAKYMEGKNVMEVIAVKFPAVRKEEFIEDIALVTQGKIMGMKTGLFPDKALIADLGRCDKVVITNKKTIFIGGKGDVSEKIKTLKNQRENSESDKDGFNARIARLQCKTAVIKVGAPSEQDLSYLKDKIEDAVYAAKGAVEEGAVRGGGIALKMIALDLPDGILKKALQSPYNQIQENAGGKFKIADDIWDSLKSTRYAVEHACNLAGALLTTPITIATKRVKPEK